MEEIFKLFTIAIATITETGAALVIGLAAIQATYQSLLAFIHGSTDQRIKEKIRADLGRWLSLGLEFELAADILRTAVTPTWNEIGQLAAIIVLRTVLNYFIQKEIDRIALNQTLT